MTTREQRSRATHGSAHLFCVTVKSAVSESDMRFLDSVDLSDVQKREVLAYLTVLWTHHSTALEGNSLTEEDTRLVLEEGATIAGKPIKDHEEVVGHVKALDVMDEICDRSLRFLTIEDLHRLHTLIVGEKAISSLHPVGAWKRLANGVQVRTEDGGMTFLDFSSPEHVDELMAEWLKETNAVLRAGVDIQDAPDIYAKIHLGFTQVHPYWDGNGRMARIVSNIPLLAFGLPPLLVEREHRAEYLTSLGEYGLSIPPLSPELGVWPKEGHSASFYAFCKQSYERTAAIIQKAVDAAREGETSEK